MAYVYRHIRKDKNVVFYIGIGKSDKDFKRAYNKDRRNPIWKNIASKTEYDVEILHEGIDWKEACDIEKELIARHKKISDGGTLCNISDGGEGGNLGHEVNKKHSETIKGAGNPKAYKVYQYTKDKEFIREWPCAKDASIMYNINPSNISDCIRGKQKTACGFVWSKIKLHEENIIPNTDTTSIMRH